MSLCSACGFYFLDLTNYSMNRKDQLFDELTQDDLKSFNTLHETYTGDVNQIILSLNQMGKEPVRVIMILMYHYDLSLSQAKQLYDSIIQ